METALSLGEGRGFFFDIIKARGGEECSAKKSCYSHQLVGMGLLKRLSRKGFGRGPLEFCHSQTPLLFWMTMLTAGCSYLCEGRRNEIPPTPFPLSGEIVFFFCIQANPPYSVIQTTLEYSFPHSFSKGLVKSCIRFLLLSLTRCVGVRGDVAVFHGCRRIKLFSYHFLWKLET